MWFYNAWFLIFNNKKQCTGTVIPQVMSFVKQPLSHQLSALVGNIHSKTCKWRESCNSRLLTFKFLAPYVLNGNREPGKMDNLLVSDTSNILSHSLFFPAKAKPKPEGWIQTLSEENCRIKPEIPGNSSKCLETAFLYPIYLWTAQWGASGAFMEQLYAPESNPWVSRQAHRQQTFRHCPLLAQPQGSSTCLQHCQQLCNPHPNWLLGQHRFNFTAEKNKTKRQDTDGNSPSRNKRNNAAG